MADYDDLPYIVIERHSAGFSPFLWGALLGAGVALLLTPRTGPETQEEIRRGVLRLRDTAEGRVNETRDVVNGAVARARGRVQDRIDTVRDVVETRAAQARHAYEAGRRAASEARSELERRIADAKDTVHAVSDAARGAPPMPPVPPAGEVIITEVIVEDVDGRPPLG